MNETVKLIPSSKLGKGIIHILNHAKERIILVSPYCDFLKWKDFVSSINKCIADGIEIYLFTREEDSAYKNESIGFLIDAGVHVYLIKRLHAKLYMNEKEAILTSSNLLHSSVHYAKEIGCFITDPSVLAQLYQSYFEDFKIIGRCISYTISFTIDRSVKLIFDYFPDLIFDNQ